MKTNKCESCLMPLGQDPGPRESDRYCSYCYQEGKLRYEGDLKGFQKNAYEGMVGKGMNKYKAKFFTWLIRFAPRWKEQN